MGIFEEYQILRHNIDLVDAHVVELHAVKVQEMATEKEYNNALNIGVRVDGFPLEKEEGKIIADIKVTVNVKDKTNDISVMKYVVIVKGVFVRQGQIEEDKFEKGVHSLAVPLLLPYARSALASVSGLMDSSIVYIPTMDVLKSMSHNEGERVNE